MDSQLELMLALTVAVVKAVRMVAAKAGYWVLSQVVLTVPMKVE